MTSQLSKEKVFDIWYIDLTTNTKKFVPIKAKNSNQAVAAYYARYGDDYTMQFDHVSANGEIIED